MSNKRNVFKGEKSIEKFLNPGKHSMLPMVELPENLNPFAGFRVRIFAKLMTFSPLGNVKALPAFNMMQGLHQRGELKQVENVIENSSGNTVFSIAMAAKQFGVKHTSSSEAEKLQDDLGRAGIKSYAWLVNQSLAVTGTKDPVLLQRSHSEIALINKVQKDHADNTVVIPWLAKSPTGPEGLKEITRSEVM